MPRKKTKPKERTTFALEVRKLLRQLSGNDRIRAVCIDPDTKHNGVAVLSWDRTNHRIEMVMCEHPDSSPRVRPYVQIINDICLVEGQEVWGPRTARPQNIVDLAYAAGRMAERYRGCTLTYRAPPNEWKGSTHKQISQARAYASLGWPYERKGTPEKGYCVPNLLLQPRTVYGASEIKPGQWKHVGDAVAMAVWVAKILTEQDRLRRAGIWH